MTSAETTPENTSTEPTERSMPEVMMMYVMPTPRTARIEAFWMMRRKFDHWANESGASALKISTMTIRMMRIWKACALRSPTKKLGFESSNVPMATVSVGGVLTLISGRPS
jgi:hypothetical protein